MKCEKFAFGERRSGEGGIDLRIATIGLSRLRLVRLELRSLPSSFIAADAAVIKDFG